MLQPRLGPLRSTDNAHRQYANQASETLQGKGSEASKEANKSTLPCTLMILLETNILFQTLPRTAMLPSALVLQRPRTLLEIKSMSRSMRYASICSDAANSRLTRVPDQGRRPQGGSEELGTAFDESSVRYHERYDHAWKLGGKMGGSTRAVSLDTTLRK